MYYWNVALSTGTPRKSVKSPPFTQCHCWDEEAAQFRQERELQKVASQQIVRQPLVVAYQQKELHCRARASDSPETTNTIMETWRISGAIYMASQRPWPVKASQSAIRSRPGKARGEEHEDKQGIFLAVLWSFVSEFHGFMLQCCTAWLKVERMM